MQEGHEDQWFLLGMNGRLGALLVIEPGEPHAIHAEEGPLVFVAFLHGAPIAQQTA